MFRSFFSSLRTRLLLLVLIAFLPALALMVHGCWTEYRRETTKANEEMNRLLRLAVKDYRQVVNKAETLLSTLDRVPFVQYGSVEACRAFFAEMVAHSGVFANIGLVSPDGTVLASAAPGVGVSMADRDWFRQAVETGEFAVSGYTMGRLVNRPVIVFAKPLFDEARKVRFVLYASADLRWMDEFAMEANLPEGAVVCVIDSEGRILTRYPGPEIRVGQMLPETPLRESILGSRNGHFQEQGPDGIERRYSYAPLRMGTSGAPFVIIGLPTDHLHQNFEQIIESAGELGLFGIVALLLTWYFGRAFIIRPVQSLLSLTGRLAEGENDARAGPPYPTGEFGQLALGFDRLAESLQQRSAEREAAMEQLRTSEEHFRRTFDQSPIGAAIVGLDHRILRVNQALCALTGYTEEELCAADFKAITHPGDLESNGTDLNRLSAGKIDAFSVEKRYVRKDGDTVWALVSIRLIRNADGTPLHYLPMIEDITAHKEAQEHLLKLNRVLTLLSECNKTLVRSLDEPCLLNRLCELIVNLGGYRMAWVGFADGDGMMRPTASAGHDEGWMDGLGAEQLCIAEGGGPAAAAVRTESPVLVRDIATDPFFESCREEALRRGYASTLSLPLAAEGKAIGALQIFAGIPDAFDPDGLTLLRELSDDMAYGIHTLRIRRENRENRASLAEKERYYRSLLVNMYEDILVIDREFRIVDANKDFLRTLGRSRGEVVGNRCHDIARGIDVPCQANGKDCHLRQVFDSGEPHTARRLHSLPRGGRMWVDILYSPLKDESGRTLFVIEALRDIAREVKLENQVRQAQKMEAIGTLAGGIAHDFNNILGIILGYTEIALYDVSASPAIQDSLGSAIEACDRAKDLVQQILSFSRQTDQEMQPLRLGVLIKETMKLLRAALPSTIEMRLAFSVEDDEDSILGDPTQVHQVLMNLCSNASHAMRERGGLLAFGLSGVEFEPGDSSRPPELEPGPYLKLTVSDTGHGIPPDIIDRIFEPYFTTKGQAEGSGLGLAVVHGIVKSHGGTISAYSEPGKGTTFVIHLPRVATRAQRPKAASSPVPGGGETILLVDDEPQLLDADKKVLERLGYRVITSMQSEKALEIFRENPDAFALVVTDQTMPKMTGLELARSIRETRSDIPIVLMSGFSEAVDSARSQAPEIDAFIMKPASMPQLAKTIRKLIDEKRTAG